MKKLTPKQQDRVRKFLAALRSGKYRQGKNALAKYDSKAKKRKFCCLGVACEVAIADGVWLNVVRDNETNNYAYNGNISVLPQVVQDYYGFVTEDPLLVTDDVHKTRKSAALVNDDLGLNFRQIADLFEKTYLDDPEEDNA